MPSECQDGRRRDHPRLRPLGGVLLPRPPAPSPGPTRSPQVAERDWRPGFTIDLQQKDLRLALEAADQMEVPLLGTAQIYQMYRTLQRAGLGGEGNHALVKVLERMAGIEVGGEE